MSLNQLLSQLGANTKATVGVSVSPSVGLEMIEVNPKTKIIEKYSYRPLDYDYSKREIADLDRFIETLGELFDELKINRKSNIILTLPSVYYSLIELPLALSDEGIQNSIIADVEQSSYIFKKKEATISWIDTNASPNNESRLILYGAIQSDALMDIKAACTEVGCTLLAIETAPNSLLKTLCFNHLADEQMAPNTVWNLMIINPNSYSMITLNGKNVVEYREEPLALRSFVGDEIYEAIISSSQLTLQTVSANYLYIVSETDIVSAEVLSMKIPFDGNIKFLESNKYVQEPLMDHSYNILQNQILKITPEVVGSGIYQLAKDFPFKFNLTGEGAVAEDASFVEAPKIFVGNTEIELTSAFVKKCFFIGLFILALIFAPAFFILNYLFSTQDAKLQDINNQISQNQTELQNYEAADRKGEFDVKLEINTVQASNRKKLIYYSAIGANMPEKTWLIYLKIFDDKQIDIIGRSLTSEAVYAFYKGLKMSVINSDLRLQRFEMSADSVGNLVIEDYNKIKPTFYEFEITNLSENELRKIEDELNAVEKDENGNPKSDLESAPKKRKGFLFEDFLKLPNTSVDINGEQAGQGNNNSNNNQGEPPKNLPANLESIEKF